MNRKALILGNALAIATLYALFIWQIWMQAMQGVTIDPIAALIWVYLWARTTMVAFDFFADLCLRYMDKIDREDEAWLAEQMPPLFPVGVTL